MIIYFIFAFQIDTSLKWHSILIFSLIGLIEFRFLKLDLHKSKWS